MPDSLLTNTHNGVVTLTINRPQVRNAVDAATMIALRQHMEQFSAEPDTRVFVITGAEGAFSSGADIQAAMASGVTPLEAQNILTEAYGPAIRGIRACPWPVIAAVDGFAAGIGCDLALACDIRLLSERGKLAELFIRVGLIPDGGGTYLLPRLVGVGKAFEMMVTGETVAAPEALTIGPHVEEALVRAVELAALTEALMTLVESDRALLEALYVDERTPAEVAASLGIAPGTLYTRKNRALERLRDAFRRRE